MLLILYAVYAMEKKVVHFIMPVVGCTILVAWREESKESVGCRSTDDWQVQDLSENVPPTVVVVVAALASDSGELYPQS